MRSQDNQQFRLGGCLGLLPERQPNDGNIAKDWNLAVRALVAIIDEAADDYGFSVTDGDGGVGTSSLNDRAAEIFRNVHRLLTESTDFWLHCHLHKSIGVNRWRDLQNDAHFFCNDCALLSSSTDIDCIRNSDGFTNLNTTTGVVRHHNAWIGKHLHAVL